MWGRCSAVRKTPSSSHVCLTIIVLLTMTPMQPILITHGLYRMVVRCWILSSRYVISQRNHTAREAQRSTRTALPPQASSCSGIRGGINTPPPLSHWLIWELFSCLPMRSCRSISVQEAMALSSWRTMAGLAYPIPQRTFPSILTPCM